MHIHELADYCTFDEVAIGGTLPVMEEYRAFKPTCTVMDLERRFSLEDRQFKFATADEAFLKAA